jgi:hypothetical protein
MRLSEERRYWDIPTAVGRLLWRGMFCTGFRKTRDHLTAHVFDDTFHDLDA